MIHRLKALVVDDERLARKLLKEMLENKHLEDIEVVGEADCVSQAALLSVELQPDVIFLDIQMPREGGFSLLPHLVGLQSRPSVIFVTAFDEYAVRAFEANALDYLLKPLREERLDASTKRLQASRTTAHAAADLLKEMEDKQRIFPKQSTYQPLDIIAFKDNGSLLMAKASDILAVKSEGAYCHIFIANRKTLMINRSISYWESHLPACTFERISRSLILNKGRISAVKTVNRETAELYLEGLSEPILVSRLESARLRAAFA